MVNKLIIIILAVTFFACSRNPYTATNKLYKNQAKAYGKVMAAYPIEDTMQTAAYFVGTTNFNMRKPNFVIIHHTAQTVANKP